MHLPIFILSALALAREAAAVLASGPRISPPAGCKIVKQHTCNSTQYSNISAAVASLTGKSHACIFVYPGNYTEQVTVSYGYGLAIYGYTTDVSSYKANTVTVSHNISSPEAGLLDDSSAINARSSNFSLYNVNVENTYGQGAQAVAMTANGNYHGYYGCSFRGFQDTLYAKAGSSYFSNCYIEGAVDYIFGDGASWFGQCTIASNGGGAITANSRQTTTDTAWYVIDHSWIGAAANFSLVNEVYLGRPWRVLARVMYQFNDLTNVINPIGWTTLAANATPIFEEWNNTGAGSNTTQRVQETNSTGPVSMSELWPGGYDWIDPEYLY